MAYNPAGNLTSTSQIQHLATVYYQRKMLDQLMKIFLFLSVTEPDVLPLRSGKTVQFFRYNLFAANTQPSAEGAVGNSLILGSSTISATVSEYSDYVTLSTLLTETAIDPIAENAAEQLGYRAGISVDTIVRTEFDSPTGGTAPTLSTLGPNGTIADLRRAVAVLSALDVRPREGSDFVAIIHPYVLYDVMADNTAGGFVDIMKYANPNVFVEGSVGPRTWSNGEVGKVESCRLLKSTNVKTSGSAPNVLYYTYVVGKGACGAVSLSGRGPSNVMDPTRQKFKVNVIPGKPSIADPEGKIGAAVSYRFVFVAKLLDTTTYRYRIIQMDSSIV